MEGYMAEIRLFSGTYAPESWVYCRGQLLNIVDYQALFALIGTQYGGNGRTTMGVPDLRGRFAVGSGEGIGVYPKIRGQMGGNEVIRLMVNQIPSHSHAATMHSPTYAGTVKPLMHTGRGGSESNEPENNFMAPSGNLNIYNSDPTADKYMGESPVTIAEATPGSVNIGNAGNSDQIYIMSPFTCLDYIMCVQGIWPPRP